jgi:hypothetical protein
MTNRTKLLSFIIGASSFSSGVLAASSTIGAVLSEAQGQWPTGGTWLLVAASGLAAMATTIKDALKPIYDRLMKTADLNGDATLATPPETK